MTELEIYKAALEKISKYGIKPTSETEIQRIHRLKSIADKALNIAFVSNNEVAVCPDCGKSKHIEADFCEDCINDSFVGQTDC